MRAKFLAQLVFVLFLIETAVSSPPLEPQNPEDFVIPVATPTEVPTVTATPTPSATPTATSTATPTSTPTTTPEVCPTPSISVTGGSASVSGSISQYVVAANSVRVTCPAGFGDCPVTVGSGSSSLASPVAEGTTGNGAVSIGKTLYPTQVGWPIPLGWYCWYGNCHVIVYYWTYYAWHNSSDSSYVSTSNRCGPAAANLAFYFSAQGAIPGYWWGVYKSPLALVLEPGVSFNDLPVSLVSFKLSEDQPAEQRTVWYGSHSTGILVWLPGAEDKVVDGRNLFGTWTFGRHWNSGYEALASLDADGSGALTGGELAGIKLWVDHDANGVTDVGEIVELSAYGVTEISTRSSGAESNELYGIKAYLNPEGYTFSRDGQIAKGTSFDWFIEGTPDAQGFSLRKKALETAGYRLYEFAEQPLDFGENKINGIIALRKSPDGYEGLSFGATGANNVYNIAKKPLAISTGGDSLRLGFESFGEKVVIEAALAPNGDLTGKSITYDKRELFKSLGGMANYKPKDGAPAPLEVYTSSVKIGPAKTLPLFVEELEPLER